MSNGPIEIGGRTISADNPPFIIAEMSGNHSHSLAKALEIVDAAADAGADAIKLQTYTADTMTVPGAMTINDPKSLWNGRELYDLYKEAYTPWEWTQPLFERAAKRGLVAFSSPFDISSVDFLEGYNVPVYKIASFENTDWVLLRRVARIGKPVIMSTGGSSLAEIDEAVAELRRNGCKDLILLKCTSAYPAGPETMNLRTIPHLAAVFDCPVGLSDHSMGVGAAVAAVAMGARVIEKHFMLRRADGGVDSAFSLEPAELSLLVRESKTAWAALGRVMTQVDETERSSRAFKRGLYVTRDVKVGEVIEPEFLASFRPATGIPTKYFDLVAGRPARRNLAKGMPVTWTDI